MQLALLITAGIVWPLAFLVVMAHMKARRIESPPMWPMFFLFGTVGGWMLAIALSPSGMAGMCAIFLVTVAPVALLWSSVRLDRMKSRTIYHRIAMWGGFGYVALLGAMVFLTRSWRS